VKTPKLGQRVWVYHLTTEKGRLGGAHALKPVPRFAVEEREFYGVIRPSWAKGQVRWAIKPVGKTADFGTGAQPGAVFESAEEARIALTAELDRMIGKLSALRNLVVAGSNGGDLECRAKDGIKLQMRAVKGGAQ